VTLPNGLQIASISVAFALENGEVVNMAVTAPGNVFLTSNPGTVTGPITLLGDYLVELSGGTMFNTTNWTVTFNVTQPRGNNVPEPMTPALMGVALAGLLLARRRKQ
jgi:hypothetical protein